MDHGTDRPLATVSTLKLVFACADASTSPAPFPLVARSQAIDRSRQNRSTILRIVFIVSLSFQTLCHRFRRRAWLICGNCKQPQRLSVLCVEMAAKLAFQTQ